MLTIRLQRVGRKNQAAFRIVLAEKQRAVKKQVVEILGHYNPRSKEFGVKDPERVKYWIGQHVQLSPTVHNLLIDKNLLAGEKVKSWRPKTKSAPAGEPAQAAAAKTDVPAPETAKTEEAPKPEETKPEEKPAAAAPAPEEKQPEAQAKSPEPEQPAKLA